MSHRDVPCHACHALPSHAGPSHTTPSPACHSELVRVQPQPFDQSSQSHSLCRLPAPLFTPVAPEPRRRGTGAEPGQPVEPHTSTMPAKPRRALTSRARPNPAPPAAPCRAAPNLTLTCLPHPARPHHAGPSRARPCLPCHTQPHHAQTCL